MGHYGYFDKKRKKGGGSTFHFLIHFGRLCYARLSKKKVDFFGQKSGLNSLCFLLSLTEAEQESDASFPTAFSIDFFF